MRVLLLAAVMAAMAACGAYSFPSGTVAGTGRVSGVVTVYPCAPVEQQGQTCTGLAGGGIPIIFVNGMQTVTVTTGSDGRYAVDLQAGTWKVTFKGIMRIIRGPNPVTVPAGGSVEADYLVDSGIRAPGPPAAVP